MPLARHSKFYLVIKVVWNKDFYLRILRGRKPRLVETVVGPFILNGSSDYDRTTTWLNRNFFSSRLDRMYFFLIDIKRGFFLIFPFD